MDNKQILGAAKALLYVESAYGDAPKEGSEFELTISDKGLMAEWNEEFEPVVAASYDLPSEGGHPVKENDVLNIQAVIFEAKRKIDNEAYIFSKIESFLKDCINRTHETTYEP